jgi:hypothetical protein
MSALVWFMIFVAGIFSGFFIQLFWDKDPDCLECPWDYCKHKFKSPLFQGDGHTPAIDTCPACSNMVKWSCASYNANGKLLRVKG